MQAMNTGHDGSMSTIHANSAADALARLCSLVLQEVPGWPLEAIHDQVRRSIDVVVHVGRSVGNARSRHRGRTIRSERGRPAPPQLDGERFCDHVAEATASMTMLLATAVGLLAALIAAPVIRRTMLTSRRPSSRDHPAIARRANPDYAALLDAIARRVRSGSSLTSAVVDEIDHSTPLGDVADRLADGGSLAAALTQVVRHDADRHADLALTVQALSATAHLGGPVAATLDEAAAVLRERAAARAERRGSRVAGAAQRRCLTIVPWCLPCGALWPVTPRDTTCRRRGRAVRVLRLGTESGRLAVDEANDRADVMLSMGITIAGSFLIVMLIAWRARHVLECVGFGRAPRAHACWESAAAAIALFSPSLAAMAAVALLVWRQWSGMHRRARTARRLAHDFPEALDLLVLSIRAGYMPAQAIVEIVPFLPTSIRPAFTAVDVAMQRGDRFADALGRLQTQLGIIAQPLVDSLSAADRYGLPLAPVLATVARGATATAPRHRRTAASCPFAWPCRSSCAPCHRSSCWPSSPCSSEPCRRCTPERPSPTSSTRQTWSAS